HRPSASRRPAAAKRAPRLARPPWRRRASCSMRRRRGEDGRPPRPDAIAMAVTAPPPLDRAIGEFLAFLRVERGLAPATLRAYGSDLRDFAAARGTAARSEEHTSELQS